jgi:hypothetical protein
MSVEHASAFEAEFGEAEIKDGAVLRVHRLKPAAKFSFKLVDKVLGHKLRVVCFGKGHQDLTQLNRDHFVQYFLYVRFEGEIKVLRIGVFSLPVAVNDIAKFLGGHLVRLVDHSTFDRLPELLRPVLGF